MSSAPTPPTISSGRAILVAGGWVITSALVLALLWWVLVPVPVCENCSGFLSFPNNEPTIVSLMLATASQGTFLPYLFLVQLFSSLGGALSIIGHFAPWALLTGAFLLLDSCGKQSRYNTTPTGADLTWQNDFTLLGGVLTIGAAISALAIGVGALRRRPTAPITLFLLVMTLLSAGVLIYEAALLIGGAFPFYGAPDIEFVQFEPGFWASAAGAALSLAGAVILLMVSRRAPIVATERVPAREAGATKQSAS